MKHHDLSGIYYKNDRAIEVTRIAPDRYVAKWRNHAHLTSSGSSMAGYHLRSLIRIGDWIPEAIKVAVGL